MSAPIEVLFEGCGRRARKTFDTVSGAAGYLVEKGYTRASGAPHYTPSIVTRLYKSTGSGRYARVNTATAPGSWPVVIDEVTNLAGEIAFWRDLYEPEPSPCELGDHDMVEVDYGAPVSTQQCQVCGHTEDVDMSADIEAACVEAREHWLYGADR